MRVLLAHCHYQVRGGEDATFEQERDLLASSGIDVQTYARSNDEIRGWGWLRKAALPLTAIRSPQALRDIVGLVRSFRPEVVHFHNVHPLISPGAFRVARQAGAAVVHTVYNFRLSCPNGLFLRDGRPCEDCAGRSFAWPGILHACYRSSRLQSAAVAAVSAFHHRSGTWSRQVDAYAALSHFGAEKLIQAGIRPDRVIVKAPVIRDPGPPVPIPADGTVLFVGRLSEEKGIADLLSAVAALRLGPRLRIVGDGPEASRLRRQAADLGLPPEAFAGSRDAAGVALEMSAASLVVVPSRFYETFGRVVVEAWSSGRPVVAADHGALAGLVTPGETGETFKPGSVPSLQAAIGRALGSYELLTKMGRNARALYDRCYGPSAAMAAMLHLYGQAIRTRTDPKADAH